MYALTNNKDEIIKISSVYELNEEYRNIKVDDYVIAYGPEEKINVYEVDEIPEGLENHKWCYTKEKGFYKNLNYQESKDPLEERVNQLTQENKALNEQITEIQVAIAEMAEMEV